MIYCPLRNAQIEFQAMEQHLLAGPGSTPPHAAAPLYRSVLDSISSMVQQPACAAALEGECTLRQSTAHHLLEVLLAQVRSWAASSLVHVAACARPSPTLHIHLAARTVSSARCPPHAPLIFLTVPAFLQMLSCGPRAMASSPDFPEELLEAPRGGLWAAAQSVLRAAPNAGLCALLELSAKRGSALLVSTLLHRDNRAMQ